MKATGVTRVVLTPSITSDNGIVDVARISFSRKAEDFSQTKNVALLSYLARNAHWSPFGHAYKTFNVPLDYFHLPALLNLISEVGTQGFIFSIKGKIIRITLSIWKLKDILDFLREGKYGNHKGTTVFVEMANVFCFDFSNSCYYLFKDFIDTAAFQRISEVSHSELLAQKDTKHLMFKMDCYAPMFVVRQLGKHQVNLCWNEESRRYVDSVPELYKFEEIRARPEESVKQGSGGKHEHSDQMVDVINSNYAELTLARYEQAIQLGVAPEQARALLDQRMMVSWCWTGNLDSIFRILRQRLYKNAQKETRDFALLLGSQVIEVCKENGVDVSEIEKLQNACEQT